MRARTALAACLLCLVALFVGIGGVAGAETTADADGVSLQDSATVDIDSELAEADGEVELLVGLAESDERASVEQLQQHAAQSQEGVRQFAAQTEGVTIENGFWITNAVAVSVDTDRVPVEALARVEGVEWIERNAEVRALDTRAETGGTAGTASPATAGGSVGPTTTDETTYGLEQIRAPAAWETYDTRGEGTRVAVLDTGVDPDHPDIDLAGWAAFDENGNQQNISPKDFDPGGHGTHVSGTVAGGSAGGQHIGVAPAAELYHGAVLTQDCSSECVGSLSQIVAGMEWGVANDADVLSMSLGAEGYFEGYIDAVRNAHDQGTVVIASSGNSGGGTSGTPGNVYDSIAVGATDSNRDVGSFSSGETVDTSDAWGSAAPDDWPDTYVVPTVSAPGVGVESAAPGGGYQLKSGTSMAAPHVSGAAALIQSATAGNLSPADLETALESTAKKPSGEDGRDTRYGAGIIDVPTAIAAVGNTTASTAGWTFETDGSVWSSPTVVDGRAIVGSDDGNVYAFDALTGDREWTVETRDRVRSSPAVANVSGEGLTVFVGSDDTGVYAIDAETGERNWRFSTNGSVESSPTVANGIVVVGSMDGNVYGLDAQTGEEVWRFETGARVRSSPTVVGDGGDQTVVVGSMDGNVYALDADTGTGQWFHETGDGVWSSPTVSDGLVYVGSRDGSIYALSADTGAVGWTFETGDWVYSSPTVADGTVIVGSFDGNVYGLDAGTGTERWRFDAGAEVFSSPTVANGTAVVGSWNGEVYGLNVSTGGADWSFETDGRVSSSPTVLRDTAYVGSADNTTYALSTNVEGTSNGSRVRSGTLGHHHSWAGTVPTAQFLPTPSNPDPNEEVLLDASPTIGNIDFYKWDLSNNGTTDATGETVTTTFDTLGANEVTLTAVDTANRRDTTTRSIRVGDGVPSVTGNNQPQDLNGDGLFEDVRGDGTVDVFDVQTLFANLDSTTVQNNAAAFNFQGGNANEVTVFDVQALFTEL